MLSSLFRVLSCVSCTAAVVMVVGCGTTETPPVGTKKAPDRKTGSGSHSVIDAASTSAADAGAVDARKPVSSGAATDFVDLAARDPSIRFDIRYATTRNFTKTIVYPVARCLLRRAIADRLIAVQRDLRARKLGLLIWDCYRPLSVQEIFWKLVPDPRYVAPPVFRHGKPVKGSKHNRGAAVDLTLVDASGKPVAMPTDHDDFSRRAHHSYRGGSTASRRNRTILRRTMKRHGFSSIPTEWWHYDGPGWRKYKLSNRPL